jgi:hypothetical protein
MLALGLQHLQEGPDGLGMCPMRVTHILNHARPMRVRTSSNVSSRTSAFARGPGWAGNVSHEGLDNFQMGCKLCNQNVHLGILFHPDSTLSVF